MRPGHTDNAVCLPRSYSKTIHTVFVLFIGRTEKTPICSGENLLFLFDFTWRSAHNAVAHNRCVRACVCLSFILSETHTTYIYIWVNKYYTYIAAFFYTGT